jgi:hypothetical protein
MTLDIDRPRAVPSRIQHAGDHWVVIPADPSTKIAVLNTTGHEVISRCDGETSVQEICDEMASLTGTSTADIRTDVSRFLHEAESSGLLSDQTSSDDPPPSLMRRDQHPYQSPRI